MIRWLNTAACALTVVVFVASSRDPANDSGRYMDRKAGFSMTLPGFADVGPGKSGIRCMFYAPLEEGFAANTNVMIQPGGMTAEKYMAETRSGLTTTGLELVEQSERTVSGLPALLIEYAGEQRGKEMHFLALAVLGEKKTWLATCSALEENFEDYEAGFRESLASFEVSVPVKSPK